jgi:hypothetical protein
VGERIAKIVQQIQWIEAPVSNQCQKVLSTLTVQRIRAFSASGAHGRANLGPGISPPAREKRTGDSRYAT